MLLQQDRRCNYNLASPRGITILLIAINEMKLEHNITIKNAGSCSIHNSIKRPMSSINFYCIGLACARKELSAKVKEGICKAKSAQEFAKKRKGSKKILEEHK